MQDQSEHQFLSFCEILNESPQGWHSLHAAYSKDLDHQELIKNVKEAKVYLQEKRAKAIDSFNEINKMAKGLGQAVSYIFSDNDILLFSKFTKPGDEEQFDELVTKAKALISPLPVAHLDVAHNLPILRRLAVDKMESARRIQAVQALNDESKVATLHLRRTFRDNPLVMLVEDDRFTATYTTQLLARDYDVFHVRSGEEAVQYYLDYAPDAVFLDIHLPGMSGQQTLQMIKAIDPEAYIVMLSVDASKTSVSAASGSGVNGFLKKPCDRNRLLMTVRRSPHIQIVHTS